jgi:two-component system chemotaxis sensor kinase CheA
MDQLLEQFLSEARENLAFIEQNIENLGDADSELLNSVFRAIHTLKGGSAIVGFDSVMDITHHAEDLLGMLRDEKLVFSDAMIEVLYNAFDEVLNLVEATEESEDIVEADEDTLNKIVTSLSEQMGEIIEAEVDWKINFLLVEDATCIVNLPLKSLFKDSSHKVVFKKSEINEEFCLNENFYVVVFDIDESSMLHGRSPLHALSTLGDKVMGVYSCMSDENAKSILSGIENEDGLLLKVELTAFIKATYQEIENSLFNFMDELRFLPLDISRLLSINVGETGHQIESLKELNSVTENAELSDIVQEVKKSMLLVGSETLQHAQLQRFLDISNLIDDNDISKLGGFFDNIYTGKVYEYDENAQIISAKIEPELEVESQKEHTQEIKQTIQNIAQQQLLALDYIECDDDLERVKLMMSKIAKFIPEMPTEFRTKEEIKSFLQSHFKTVESQEVSMEDDFEEEVVQKVDAHKAVVGKTVKVDQESIDSLMNIVGELLVAKNSLPYLADNVVRMTHETIKREIIDKYIFINRLSEQLQDLILGMRMLPIAYVFDRYPKLVRDISKKLGKKVTLKIDGSETKLDKNMIEMLADPLIHIMRNSLDHGIEMPDVRERKGKSPSGNVTLRAFAQSDKIMIEIKDDGAGINVTRVAAKVLEKDLMTHE